MAVLYASLAVVLAAFAAFVELIARYRDEPFKTLAATPFGWVYLGVNAIMGAIAYAILLQTVETASVLEHLEIALGAGIGAAAILRTRIITARVNSKDVAIGPGYVLEQLLAVLDRQIDRERAVARTHLVKAKMKDIDFAKAGPYAKIMITGSMQNLSPQESKEFEAGLDLIGQVDAEDQEKAYALGFLILDYAGEDLFDAMLRDDSRSRLLLEPVDEPEVPADEDLAEIDSASRRTELVRDCFEGVMLQQIAARVDRLIEQGPAPEVLAALQALHARIAAMVGAGETSKDLVFQLGFAMFDSLGAEYLTTHFADLVSPSSDSTSGGDPGDLAPSDDLTPPQTDSGADAT